MIFISEIGCKRTSKLYGMLYGKLNHPSIVEVILKIKRFFYLLNIFGNINAFRRVRKNNSTSSDARQNERRISFCPITVEDILLKVVRILTAMLHALMK